MNHSLITLTGALALVLTTAGLDSEAHAIKKATASKNSKRNGPSRNSTRRDKLENPNGKATLTRRKQTTTKTIVRKPGTKRQTSSAKTTPKRARRSSKELGQLMTDSRGPLDLAIALKQTGPGKFQLIKTADYGGGSVDAILEAHSTVGTMDPRAGINLEIVQRGRLLGSVFLPDGGAHFEAQSFDVGAIVEAFDNSDYAD